jgi:hypothetical protein
MLDVNRRTDGAKTPVRVSRQELYRQCWETPRIRLGAFSQNHILRATYRPDNLSSCLTHLDKKAKKGKDEGPDARSE